MLLETEALKHETRRYNSGVRHQYTFSCRNCRKDIKVWRRSLSTHSGLCCRCVHRSRFLPFGSLFNRLKQTAMKRGITCTLTYEQFLIFVQSDECVYCARAIEWRAHAQDSHKQTRLNLDRKDSSYGYSLENVVVCCWECNLAKSDVFTYVEFIEIVKVLKTMRGANIWANLQVHGFNRKFN